MARKILSGLDEPSLCSAPEGDIVRCTWAYPPLAIRTRNTSRGWELVTRLRSFAGSDNNGPTYGEVRTVTQALNAAEVEVIRNLAAEASGYFTRYGAPPQRKDGNDLLVEITRGGRYFNYEYFWGRYEPKPLVCDALLESSGAVEHLGSLLRLEVRDSRSRSHD